MLNCPNCGAPVTQDKCPYCGTVFLDFAAIQLGAPSYVKFKVGDSYICARLVVDNLDIEVGTETADYYGGCGCKLGSVVTGYDCRFHMDAHAVMASNDEALVTCIVG